ncbi:hypothetical protein [Phenylobacterium sp.]|uniref:hypothetical protein n=1 Tax=Phenylobacterium sp. TaxID=1871053 RepID=UPI0025DE9B33|nr:hypothetical protein [Phenylobacterium sp.]
MGIWAAALCAMPAAAAAGPLDLYVERTAMTAADARCGLFGEELRAALDAGRLQARNAAVRAGADPEAIARADRQAVAAATRSACDSDSLRSAADHVRAAFDGFSQTRRITYPGERADWRADRTAGGEQHRWRLAQDAAFDGGRMVFGLAGRDGRPVLLALASFADGRTPYAARLAVRDVDRAGRPYLGLGARADLSGRLPPPAARRTFAAEARSRAGLDLMPETMTSGWAFRFPAEAAATLAELDPREAVAVEFLFSDGTPVRRAYVEVGDFAAGRAFLRMAAR